MEEDVYQDLAERLLNPEHVYSRAEATSRRSVVPARAGVYAWYFDDVPPGVPTEECRVGEFGMLLYVGIAPKAPPMNGARRSKQHLRQRVGYHFNGNAYGSTLRLTLGCHLTEHLGIALRRVGSGTRLTFTNAGEERLSEWMGAHARVAFVLDDEPWKLEHELIKREVLPLNIAGNSHSPYCLSLRTLREEHKRRARELPVAS